MQEQSQVPQPTPALYSENLKTKSKTYFFDVKAAKNGNKYLSISESWIKNGQKFRSTLTVFQDSIKEFSQLVSDIQTKVQ